MQLRRAWFVCVLLLYLLFTCYHLGLPGLHYDEAKEAGLNAMEILTGAPVTAFRGAGIAVGGRTFPVMVQDYIGALNVYLALPLLGLSGIGVPNLRLLPILTGLLALVLVERAVSEWVFFSGFAPRKFSTFAPHKLSAIAPRKSDRRRLAPLSLSGLITITLLAVSPTYIFWARQGIFVTNLMLPFVFLCIWQGLVWLRSGRSGALLVAALAGGLALYAKLLAVWAVAPFVLLAGGWWLVHTLRHTGRAPQLRWTVAAGALVLFMLPLLPLLLFNAQTGGTFASVGGNLRQSYYGVDNANVVGNLPVRWDELLQVLRGEQFWYLGGSYANWLAPWLAALALAAGLWRDWRRTLPPIVLALAVFVLSLFTLSDLFITHYVLLQPIVVAAVGVALGTWLEGAYTQPGRVKSAPSPDRGTADSSERTSLAPPPQLDSDDAPVSAMRRQRPRLAAIVVAVLVGVWVVCDFANVIRYHQALAASGGLADHSDASYHLAYHLQFNGMGAPIALDWGVDAPVRYLTGGTVTPIEIFGYASPAAPDADFVARLEPFLANPDNRYLLHAPGAEVFHGRREAFLAAAEEAGGHAVVEQQFAQHDGSPLYEIWRVER